jgi:hypothetical protein
LIVRRVVYFACGLAALSAAAFVGVVALAFSLYAALKEIWGPAWASAGVAGACLLLILALAVVLMLLARPPRKKPGDDKDILTRALDLAQEKPWVAISAIAAAAVVAWKNPKALAAVAAAFAARGQGDKSAKK